MANVPIYNLTDTWNAGGTTFDAIKMAVTDTASSSGSRLLDLLVDSGGGAASKFRVDKAGNVTAAGTLGVGGSDCILLREAANELAMRNAANAQNFRIYNTYTDASNYERGFLRWDTNVLKLGTESIAASSPTGRALMLSAHTWTNLTLGNGATNLESPNLTAGGTFDFRVGRSSGTDAQGTPLRVANQFVYNNTTAATRYQVLWSGSVPAISFNANNRTGVFCTAPDRRLEVNDTDGNCLRLTYNDADGSAANYADFLVSSSGDLTITPSGGDVAITGAVETAAPTGGTAAKWKLGTVASVSPTSPDRTIEVEIGGTTYYLAAKTTND